MNVHNNMETSFFLSLHLYLLAFFTLDMPILHEPATCLPWKVHKIIPYLFNSPGTYLLYFFPTCHKTCMWLKCSFDSWNYQHLCRHGIFHLPACPGELQSFWALSANAQFQKLAILTPGVWTWNNRILKVTVHLQGCLIIMSKLCSTPGLNCRYLNPYIKLKLIELAVYSEGTRTGAP